MIRKALLLGLLLSSCSTAAPNDTMPDAPSFETSADSSMPPLPDLDAASDAGSDAGLDASVDGG